jgi:putative flippase GtrA
VNSADPKGPQESTSREGHDLSHSAIAAPSASASAAEGNRRATRRWLKFNAVGGLGIGVQLAVLLTLKSGFHLTYLPATALAVEAAVLHNFLWHERYTWADRVQTSWRKSLPRLLRFNLTTGVVSVAGNLALMKLMVDLGHMNYLVANGIAIALCSLANFLVSEVWVFAESQQQRARVPAPHKRF